MLDRDLGSKLAAPLSRSDFLAARPAIDPTSALQFNEIASVAKDHGLIPHFFGDIFTHAAPAF
jgi:hypothetical protein